MLILFDENVPVKLVEAIIPLTAVLNSNIKISSIHLLNKAGTPDYKVLEIVGKNGVLISYDKDFKTHKHLYQIIKEYETGVFFIQQPKIKTFWILVQLVIQHWEDILDKSENEQRPFLFEVRKTGVERRQY